MARFAEERRGRAAFDDLAGIHDHDPVAHLGHDAEIVGDQQHRHAELLLQPAQEFENLRLDRHIECRRRLVRDQQLRPADQCHRDHHALAQAARELVRILLETPLRRPDADGPQHRDAFAPRLGPAHPAMQPQHLFDLEADRERRVEARHRLLEDHADPVATHGTHRIAGKPEQVLAVEQHAARLDARGRRRDQAHDGHGGNAFAAAAFADKADRLAGADGEVDVVKNADESVLGAEPDGQPFDRKQRGRSFPRRAGLTHSKTMRGK